MEQEKKRETHIKKSFVYVDILREEILDEMYNNTFFKEILSEEEQKELKEIDEKLDEMLNYIRGELAEVIGDEEFDELLDRAYCHASAIIYLSRYYTEQIPKHSYR